MYRVFNCVHVNYLTVHVNYLTVHVNYLTVHVWLLTLCSFSLRVFVQNVQNNHKKDNHLSPMQKQTCDDRGYLLTQNRT